MLDEYCENTGESAQICDSEDASGCEAAAGQEENPLIGVYWEITGALVQVWENFEYPCGQKFKAQRKVLDSDNGTEFMSEILYKYCECMKFWFILPRGTNHKNGDTCIK